MHTHTHTHHPHTHTSTGNNPPTLRSGSDTEPPSTLRTATYDNLRAPWEVACHWVMAFGPKRWWVLQWGIEQLSTPTRRANSAEGYRSTHHKQKMRGPR